MLLDYYDAIKDLPDATPVRARLVRAALVFLGSLAREMLISGPSSRAHTTTLV